MNKSPIREIARGHWEKLLGHFGLAACLDYRRKEGPCPICGGRTRFRFTDRDGYGNYYCNNSDCGPNDGINLVMACRGMTFVEVAKEIEQYLGIAVGKPTAHAPVKYVAPAKEALSREQIERRCKRLQDIWQAAKPIVKNDAAGRYLLRRGLTIDRYPDVMRLHPALDYWDDQAGVAVKLGTYPCLVSLVQDAKGRSVNLHRTYLTQDGTKAPVPCAKKTLTPVMPMAGAAIRLFEATDKLAVAEGIETALAVHQLTKGMPTWATVSAPLMKSVEWPETVKTLLIFGDRDEDNPETGKAGAGQTAAQELAKRFSARGGTAKIYLPDSVDEDFADVWLRQPRLRAAA